MAALATKFWHGAPVDYFCRFYCARLRLDEWKLNIWKISMKPVQVIIIASPMYYIIIIISLYLRNGLTGLSVSYSYISDSGDL